MVDDEDEYIDEPDPEIKAAQDRETEKMVARWQRDAPGIMSEAYTSFIGLKAPDSWSFQIRKAGPRLASMQMDSGEDTVARFLRESVIGFCFRCGGSYQQAPSSPFFADTYLFSGPALKYLENNLRRIRGHAWLGTDPQALRHKIYEDVFQSESDYWMMGQPNAAPSLDLTRPGVYWILFSRYFQRFGDHLVLDRCWSIWDYEVDYMGRSTPIKDAVDRERARMKADRNIFATATKAALDALWESTLATWARFGLGTLGIDDRNQVVLPDNGKELRSYRYVFRETGETLWEWELRWRAYLSRELSLEFDAEDFSSTVRSLSIANPKPSPVKLSRLVSTPGGGMTAFMEATLAEFDRHAED